MNISCPNFEAVCFKHASACSTASVASLAATVAFGVTVNHFYATALYLQINAVFLFGVCVSADIFYLCFSFQKLKGKK